MRDRLLERGAAARRGGRGLEDARARARRPARHPHDRRPDGRRDGRGAPAAAREAARSSRRRGSRRISSSGDELRDVRAVPRGRPHRRDVLCPARATRTRCSRRRSSPYAPSRPAPWSARMPAVTGIERRAPTAGTRDSWSRPQRGHDSRAAASSTPPAAWANELAALVGLSLADPGGRPPPQRHRAARARARADGAAHRPPADAQAVREQHVHHRRRLAGATRAAAAALLDTAGTAPRGTSPSRCASSRCSPTSGSCAPGRA